MLWYNHCAADDIWINKESASILDNRVDIVNEPYNYSELNVICYADVARNSQHTTSFTIPADFENKSAKFTKSQCQR